MYVIKMIIRHNRNCATQAYAVYVHTTVPF